MMNWDWTTAGNKNEEGKPYAEKNEDGQIIYDTKKGSYIWAKDVQPEYIWFNGTINSVTIEDNEIDPSGVVLINELMGSRDEAEARIYPVKVFTGTQFYDAGNNTLIVPNLFPSGTDETKPLAYWKGWDWNVAFERGTTVAGQEFSGELGAVDTQMMWLTTHMVAPADQAVQCGECHVAEGGRLDWVALGYNEQEVANLAAMQPVDMMPVEEAAEEPAEEPAAEEPAEEEAAEEPAEEPVAEEPAEEPAAEEPAEEPAAEEAAPEEAPASNNSTIWIIVGVIAVAVVGFFALRKKQ
jgi:hypothetical protein